MNVDHLSYDPLRLRAETEKARIALIRTDLDLCLTFARVAETAISMGHREHAERTIATAEKGYSDMIQYFHKATGMTAEVESEFQSKFRRLRERLDGLQRLRQS